MLYVLGTMKCNYEGTLFGHLEIVLANVILFEN